MVQNFPSNSSTDELVRILELRANKITRDLASKFPVVNLKTYLESFSNLHQLHIDALKRGNLMEAHEVLTQIHELSRDLEADALYKRDNKQRQKVLYNIRFGSFLRGPLIEWYSGIPAMTMLVEEALTSLRAERRVTPGEPAVQELYAALVSDDGADKPSVT